MSCELSSNADGAPRRTEVYSRRGVSSRLGPLAAPPEEAPSAPVGDVIPATNPDTTLSEGPRTCNKGPSRENWPTRAEIRDRVHARLSREEHSRGPERRKPRINDVEDVEDRLRQVRGALGALFRSKAGRSRRHSKDRRQNERASVLSVRGGF